MNPFRTSLVVTTHLFLAGCNPPECTTPEPETTGSSSSTTEGPAPLLHCNDNGMCERGEGSCEDCRLCGNGDMDPGELCDDGNIDNNDDCVDNCQIATCGDRRIRKVLEDSANDELCDDGDLNVRVNAYSYAARCLADPANPAQQCRSFASFCGDGICTPGDMADKCVQDCGYLPPPSVCGNGILEAGELCDNPSSELECNGAAAIGNGESVECQRPVCGDGYHNTEAELCDDGNFDNDDTCVRDCQPASCGDGLVQKGVEQCDDPAQPDRCVNCEVVRRVFITSTAFTALQLGGLNGADAKCNAEAEAADLPGRFRAWLSDSTGSPATRFDTSFEGSYRLVNDTEVAKGWAGLTGGALKAPINVGIKGNINNTAAWTNTAPTGSPAPMMSHCSNWTANVGTSTIGDSSATNGTWTIALAGQGCNSAFWLYCFEDR